MDYIIRLCLSMLTGVRYTVGLFLITLFFAVPLGLLLSFMRISKISAFRGVTSAYVWFMRGTPLLLQLFFFCYGVTFLPVVGSHLVMSRFQAACLAFILNYAAYFCEIFRGGMLSVDAGQHEAAKVLGFSKWQTTAYIIIPQMLRVSLPPISNESITLVKDTALVTAIGITEILYFAKSAVNRDVNVLAFVLAAIFYLVMTYLLTKLFDYLEKKYSF